MSLHLIRRLHRLTGLVFAPTLLFLALTGTVQVFDLHKFRPGYTPANLILRTTALHKNQTLRVRSRPPPPATGKAEARPTEVPSFAQSCLKIFAALASASLALTTAMGVVLALRSHRERTLSLLCLLAGVAVPALFIICL